MSYVLVFLIMSPREVTVGNRPFSMMMNHLAYIELIAEWCRKHDVAIWAWCLMPNHVHLIAVPQNETGLARAIGEAHRRYTRRINFREKWRGHLWQERFASFPMDELHLLAAVRYVEMNPVAAGIVSTPAQYRWSSVHAHLAGKNDNLADVLPLLDMISDWEDFLYLSTAEELKVQKLHERTGHPLGSDRFLKKMEVTLGRVLRPQEPGPKKKKS